jgi:hypothetical protein
MATQALRRWLGAVAVEHRRQTDERKLATLLDSCLERMADGREPGFALRHSPEAAADVRPLLEIATLLRMRGRLAREMVS